MTTPSYTYTTDYPTYLPSASYAIITGISNWSSPWTSTAISIPSTYTATYTADSYTYTVPVTDISGNVFNNSGNANATSITSIALTSNVTTIGAYAFANLTSLTTITNFSTNITSLGNYAFSGCSSLTTFTIPDSLSSIGNGTFYNCSELTSISIPATVTEINLYAFGGCTALESLEILGSSVTIDSSSNDSANPFYNTSISNLLCTNSSGTYTYELTIGADPTTIIQTFYNSEYAPSGWIPTTGYSSYPKYVFSNSDPFGGSGMSFTTSYNSTDASNTYITSTYGNVAINAIDSTNIIYLGCTDCSSNVNNNLGNTVNDVYMGGNLTVDASLNVGGNLTVDGSLNVGGYTTFGGGTPFMKIQYGYGQATAVVGYDTNMGTLIYGNVAFNQSFKSTPYVLVTANGYYNGSGSYKCYPASVYNVNTTGFQAYINAWGASSSSSVNFYWIAIGN
jgi:hypothetical protein